MSIFQKITLKNLKENRTRTLVTIIGIILSAAMFTAVTISVSSYRNFLVSHTIYTTGSWYGSAYNLTKNDIDTITSDEKVSDSVSMNRIGYAQLEGCQNKNKPYLCIYGITENFADLMPVHLLSGRMPENDSEIILPEHLSTNGGITYELNDTLSLEIGTRTDTSGYVLDNHTAYFPDDSDEEIVDSKTHTYTIVGFYERPSFEDYSAPGYTALTISNMPADGSYDIYLCTKDGNEINSYMKTIYDKTGNSTNVNYSLLRFYGYSSESSFNSAIINLAVILIFIIAFGSISLIYNAFSISVSERTRQFGLLSSIGATRHQLVSSVLFEALTLSVIGIPLGILSGVIGIAITFYFTGNILANFLYSDSGITLSLHASLPALGIAVFVSLITILISAWLPARRAMKQSAIESIRQSRDIAISSKKVRTSKLTQKLFGFEGMLAAKNYKRNRKKYRATVLSLFLSVVLFISASSFCAYLTKSVDSIVINQDYDISYNAYLDESISIDTLMEELSGVSGVTTATYYSNFYLQGTVNTNALSGEYRNYQEILAEEESWDFFPESQTTLTDYAIFFVNDDTFRTYLKDNGLSEADYFDSSNPAAVMVDQQRLYYAGKYYSCPLLSSFQNANATLQFPKEKEGYHDNGYDFDENGNILYSYVSDIYDENDHAECIELPAEECSSMISLNISASLPEPPSNVYASYSAINLYYPYSMIDPVFSELEESTSYCNLPDERPISNYVSTELSFQCEDHTQAAKDMTKILSSHGLSTGALYDYAASRDKERAIITVINVFSYGFIILISLIAAANVFNTISTNISLRKREFAMLKSIGLTPDGFRKMMNFECMLYGFKGLLYGLPVSILITWLIHRAISGGLEMNFFIPWYSIVIAVGSVFLVVFATMLYSTQKLKKGNIMDTLKDENI